MRILSRLFVVAAVSGPCCAAQSSVDHLADNTVLVIRHAEKPATGALLNGQGAARAQAYVKYFEPFHESTLRFSVDALYAGADSDNSSRPRLTLEPLSESTGLTLHLESGTKEPEKLVGLLRGSAHGTHPLVAWRHGQMPQLLLALGANPETLLPGGKWPDEIFDWVLVLTYDHAGKLVRQQRLTETLKVPAGS